MDTIIKKPGKKSLCYLAIVLAVALLVSTGLLYYLYLVSKLESEIEEEVSESEKLTPQEEIELQEKIAEIIKTNDFNKCQEIENKMYRTVCINNIALNLAEETQDISYCQKLDNELVSIASCEKQVLSKKSKDKEDINVCNETENSEVQKECKEKFWPYLALKKKDINLCDNIISEEEKNFCKDNYLLRLEFAKSESNFNCQKFFDQQVKSDCSAYKEMILEKKLASCGELKSNLFLNYCLSKFRY